MIRKLVYFFPKPFTPTSYLCFTRWGRRSLAVSRGQRWRRQSRDLLLPPPNLAIPGCGKSTRQRT